MPRAKCKYHQKPYLIECEEGQDDLHYMIKYTEEGFRQHIIKYGDVTQNEETFCHDSRLDKV
jgi:hypothetical protein